MLDPQNSPSESIDDLKENVGLLMQWRSEMIPWKESITTKIIEIEEYSKEHNTQLSIVSDKIEYIYNEARYKRYRDKILWGSGGVFIFLYLYSVFLV
jgi:hypothetical protein